MMRFEWVIQSLFVISCTVSSPALAQLVRPPVTEPSRTGDRLEIQPELPSVGRESVITLPDESGHQKPLKADVTFTLKKIEFENLTAFSEEQLRADYASYIGKPVSLATLNDIASKITVHYRNAGYILSRAVVPPQRINDGNIKIKIVEGFVDKVRFEGVPATGLLGRYADKIRNAKPLDAATLERYLLLMNDLPGMTAQARLMPSQSTPGASDIVITITQKQVDGSVTLDNRGTRYMGPWEAGFTGDVNNMLGLNDRTTVRGITAAESNEMRFAQLVHEEQLDSEGTKIAVSGGYTHTHPDYKLAPFDIEGRDLLLSAQVLHPFIRSRQTNLFGNVSFDVRQTDVSSLSTRLYDDRLRVARAGGSFDFVDAFSAVNKVETEFSKGFGWDVASSVGARSRATGQPDFIKGTFEATRLQPITGPFSLYLTTAGQLSANTLLVAEQFGIGGAQFGSAYDPSEITGDSGLAGRAELQFSQSVDFKYIPSYQLYGFYDIGEVWNRNPGAGQAGSESLADVGLGARFSVMEPVTGGVELAFPLTRGVAADGQDANRPRVFFSLGYHF